MTRIGVSIKAERQARGIAQKSLARQAEISAQYLNDIELGRRLPPPATLLKIANVLPDVDSTAWLHLLLADSWGAEIAETMRRWAVKQEQPGPSAGIEGECR